MTNALELMVRHIKEGILPTTVALMPLRVPWGTLLQVVSTHLTQTMANCHMPQTHIQELPTRRRAEGGQIQLRGRQRHTVRMLVIHLKSILAAMSWRDKLCTQGPDLRRPCPALLLVLALMLKDMAVIMNLQERFVPILPAPLPLVLVALRPIYQQHP